MEIWIDRQPLTILSAIFTAARPREGCALLLGHGEGPTVWRLRRVWPCLNIWEPSAERSRRFAVDPREQLLAQKWGRSSGLGLLGSAHSHPASAPLPSATDQALTLGPTLMLILGHAAADLSVTDGSRPSEAGGWELACWWLPTPPAGGTTGD